MRSRRVFIGYETTKCETEIMEVLESGAVVLKETPFYPESGGQQGDQGEDQGRRLWFKVHDTQKTPEGIILHIGELTFGEIKKGDTCLCRRLIVIAADRSAATIPRPTC